MSTLFDTSGTPEFRMAQVFLEVYGCKQLTWKFLRTVFDDMDTRKQGHLFKGDFCKLFQSSLSLPGDRSDRVLESMPDCGMSFAELKSAVSQVLDMQITQALYRAPTVHRCGAVIVLNTRGLPQDFEKFLHSAEKELGVEGRTKYAIFEEKSGKSKHWSIHAVGQEASFQGMSPSWTSPAARLPFPKSWRGCKGTDLARASGGVTHSISVSRDGCLGTSASREGAIALAARSLSSMQNRDAVIASKGVAELTEVVECQWAECEI